MDDIQKQEQYAMAAAAQAVVSSMIVNAVNGQYWEVVNLARYRDGAEYKVTLRHTGYSVDIPIEVVIKIDALPATE